MKVYEVVITPELTRTFKTKTDAIEYAHFIHNNGFSNYVKPGAIIRVYERTFELIEEVKK